MGGSGLVSTIGDYARFLAMVAGGGALDGVRVLGPRTLAYMASDHLGPDIDRRSPYLAPGYGYGLGFSVRVEAGVAPTTGSTGEFAWGGVSGAAFWVSPRDALFAIVMTHAPDHYLHFRQVFRNMVNAAIL
jgi:CubicO group peptidase (beta-lactamase class C family)